MCKFTVNPFFKILKPKRTKIQKIQQGTNNEGKWKEARTCQEKNVDDVRWNKVSTKKIKYN